MDKEVTFRYEIIDIYIRMKNLQGMCMQINLGNFSEDKKINARQIVNYLFDFTTHALSTQTINEIVIETYRKNRNDK